MPQYKLLVCTNVRYNPKNKSCVAQGSDDLLNQIKTLSLQSDDPIDIEEIKCFGQCDRGPVMRIAPAKEFFYCVGKDDLPKILNLVQSSK